MTEQLIILIEIILIDLVLAGDNAIIIGMVASKFESTNRKKIIFWGIGGAVVLRIIFTFITAYLLQITGLRLVGGILLLYICYKLYRDVIQNKIEEKNIENISFNIHRYIENNYIFKEISFEHNETKYNFKEKVMLLDLKDFENYFNKNNLKISDIYGDYKLSSFDINKSPRLILISKKNPA